VSGEAQRQAMDKSTWGPGPWQDEPDHVDFEHAGLPCILHRNGGGAWCGYAAVPPGHPAHGKEYGGDIDVTVHGGITYGEGCRGSVCHVPKPGEPDNVWWLGFDCGHAYDLAPGDEAHFRALGLSVFPGYKTYRDLAYVRRETERLAEQLAADWSAS
jgi:hypothetical protein